MRATVFGAGSWGTTFAKVLIDAGTPTTLWTRRPELADTINRTGRNADYLPDVRLPAGLRATADPGAALDGADLVVYAVPAQLLRDHLTSCTPRLPADVTLVSLVKGIELTTLLRMSEVIGGVTGAAPDRVVAVTGPNIAAEIAAEQPTATVVAGADEDRVERVQQACAAPYFRPYTNSDLIGCELAGAMKNVIALACGMGIGMGLGVNSAASVITRGLAEMTRLGGALGAQEKTFAGLAGLGDLVATCASPRSRNRSFGERLGRGGTPEQARRSARGQVAEGVESCRSILDLADRLGVDARITRAVERVCSGQSSVPDMVRAMMSRSTTSE